MLAVGFEILFSILQGTNKEKLIYEKYDPPFYLLYFHYTFCSFHGSPDIMKLQ